MANSPTIDGSTLYRCMFVALDEAATKRCTVAVRPLQPVRVADVAEACAKMSAVLPLVVVVPESLEASETAELAELVTACGAELVRVGPTIDERTLGERLLDAVRKAESRRHSR